MRTVRGWISLLFGAWCGLCWYFLPIFNFDEWNGLRPFEPKLAVYPVPLFIFTRSPLFDVTHLLGVNATNTSCKCPTLVPTEMVPPLRCDTPREDLTLMITGTDYPEPLSMVHLFLNNGSQLALLQHHSGWSQHICELRPRTLKKQPPQSDIKHLELPSATETGHNGTNVTKTWQARPATITRTGLYSLAACSGQIVITNACNLTETRLALAVQPVWVTPVQPEFANKTFAIFWNGIATARFSGTVHPGVGVVLAMCGGWVLLFILVTSLVVSIWKHVTMPHSPPVAYPVQFFTTVVWVCWSIVGPFGVIRHNLRRWDHFTALVVRRNGNILHVGTHCKCAVKETNHHVRMSRWAAVVLGLCYAKFSLVMSFSQLRELEQSSMSMWLGTPVLYICWGATVCWCGLGIGQLYAKAVLPPNGLVGPFVCWWIVALGLLGRYCSGANPLSEFCWNQLVPFTLLITMALCFVWDQFIESVDLLVAANSATNQFCIVRPSGCGWKVWKHHLKAAQAAYTQFKDPATRAVLRKLPHMHGVYTDGKSGVWQRSTSYRPLFMVVAEATNIPLSKNSKPVKKRIESTLSNSQHSFMSFVNNWLPFVQKIQDLVHRTSFVDVCCAAVGIVTLWGILTGVERRWISPFAAVVVTAVVFAVSMLFVLRGRNLHKDRAGNAPNRTTHNNGTSSKKKGADIQNCKEGWSTEGNWWVGGSGDMHDAENPETDPTTQFPHPLATTGSSSSASSSSCSALSTTDQQYKMWLPLRDHKYSPTALVPTSYRPMEATWSGPYFPLGIPKEVWQVIFTYIPISRSFMSLGLVCMPFRYLISSEDLWVQQMGNLEVPVPVGVPALSMLCFLNDIVPADLPPRMHPVLWDLVGAAFSGGDVG